MKPSSPASDKTSGVVALSPAQRQQARHALQVRRDTLSTMLEEHRNGQSRSEAARAELERLREEDDAQSDEQREFTQMMDSRETEELMAVDAALTRLAEGDYGACVQCGAGIPWKRLEAQPEAARCIDCQSALESARLQRR